METRRGRREVEVIRSRREGIKRGETKLASNHFPICSPQSGYLSDVHGVTQRREEGGRRQRWPRRIKGVIKRRETDPASNQFPKFLHSEGHPERFTSNMEERRGRRKIEVT